MESNRQIEQTAAEWIIRRDGEDWTPAEEAQLREWLGSRMAHRAAYLRLEAAWEQTFRLQALGAGTQPGVTPPPGKWRVSPFFERRQPVAETETKPTLRTSKSRLLALAAGLLLVFGVGTHVFTALDGDRYATPVGGMASIPLKDGSNITLNTASKIRVMLNEHQRLIKLDGGEAFFEVAKDARRPFIVQAGNRLIIAVGTRFSVRREGRDVQVVVTEGEVRLENAMPDAVTSRYSNTRTSASLLAAGAIAHTSNARLMVEEKTPREAEDSLSWRTGYLTFKALPLPEAIAEFNRYTSRKILIQDPQVAAFHVSGRFRATNAEAFLRVLRQGFGIEAREADDTIVLTSGRTGTPQS